MVANINYKDRYVNKFYQNPTTENKLPVYEPLGTDR